MARVAQRDIDRRRHSMTALLREHAYLPIDELCRRFGISEATARRDLTVLSREKAIVRTFGGAMADYDRRFIAFSDRLKLATRAKSRIAARAVSLLSPGMRVFLDAGTTVFAIAERLRRRPLALQIVSNSLAVAERLAGVKGIDVDLLGGRMLPSQSILLGDETCRAASRYRFDIALLGAEGFDDAGLSNSTADVVALQLAVIGRSARHAVCVDARKARVRANAALLPWRRVDWIITDAASVPVAAPHLLSV